MPKSPNTNKNLGPQHEQVNARAVMDFSTIPNKEITTDTTSESPFPQYNRTNNNAQEKLESIISSIPNKPITNQKDKYRQVNAAEVLGLPKPPVNVMTFSDITNEDEDITTDTTSESPFPQYKRAKNNVQEKLESIISSIPNKLVTNKNLEPNSQQVNAAEVLGLPKPPVNVQGELDLTSKPPFAHYKSKRGQER